jgi:isoleucyl-tRNA synthetase
MPKEETTRPVAQRSEDGVGTGDKSDVALREEAVLDFWREHDIFNKSLEQEAPNGDYVFYDGPPFATGLPHYGHILASTIKDAVPRFWTMNGYRVRRTWGWDCHGLPLENLIEKELGLATKRDIEAYGVKNFNEKARAAVMRYADDWKQIIPRMGRWADMDDDYKTMDSTYTESVWWVFKSLFDKELVYEGFKSMHLCPRCGTTLSNFEVNQGYKDIKDIAVTVKLPLLDDTGEVTDTSLLVWTTTPWTLPGNLAAAVHNEHTYVKVALPTEENGIEHVVLAKERITQLNRDDFSVVEEFPGSTLVGRRYQPPFPWLQEQEMEGKENAWQVYHADYVELGEEGTGAVHLAPAYGEEDMELAKAHGVPIFHHVNESGHFKEFVAHFAGQLVKPKDDDDAGVTHLDADILVVKALSANGKLFRKENITHSYPHCWRCDTPLLNYATTSWFVEVTKIKDELVAENNKVKWVPEHVGTNRFGKWLEGARDWAVSRQRYWGAPLPVWRNPETNDIKVFGSLEELQQYVPKSGNTYYTMRHGESEKNVLAIVTDALDKYPLTEKGEAETVATAQKFKGEVDIIIASPVLRAQQTAKLVAAELGIAETDIITNKRISETLHGVCEGQGWDEYKAQYPIDETKFEKKPEGGESWNDLRQRMGGFMYDLEQQYQGKRILIVSHGDPLHMLHAAVAGYTKEEALARYDSEYPDKGAVKELDFTPLPHNDYYELDFHRPYIDDIELYDGETKLERVPDVFDCWFESGSMPYGQHHYPFSCNEVQFMGEHYPAQFIAEGLDQTRGWFYSLIVLGTALFGQSPYQNVIVNGLIKAEDGKKLSKKLQNYSAPVDLANQVGADSMRMYLLNSPVVRGEDINFSDKEVQELQRKNIGRLHNVLTMYEMFAPVRAIATSATSDGASDIPADNSSPQVLDRWIVSRFNQLVAESTAGYQAYELDKATRPITDFIDDVSVWYLRRSRDRLKGTDEADKQLALATLRFVLRDLAKVMAPVMPFYAEHLYQAVKAEDEPESVHLTSWPVGGDVDTQLLEDMRVSREVVTAALEARTKAGIKVRQPVASVAGPTLTSECVPLVLDELNAKAYEEATEVGIDTEITPDLQAEGDAREFMRAVQDMRKKAGLQPSDTISLTVQTSDGGQAVLDTHQEEIMRTVGATAIAYGDAEGTEVTAGTLSFTVELQTTT